MMLVCMHKTCSENILFLYILFVYLSRMNMHYQSNTSQLGMAKDLQQYPQNQLEIRDMNFQ